MSLRIFSAFAMATITAAACDRGSPLGARTVPASFPVQRYAGKIPEGAADRAAEEQAALARLYAVLTDSAERKFFRESLESDDWNIQTQIVAVGNNPEAAQLLSKIYALRQVARDEASLADAQMEATLRDAPVTVALLPKSRRYSFSGVVIRTTRGENIIGIPTSGLVPERVAQLFQMLNRSRLRHGDIPLKNVRLYAQGERTARASSERIAFARDVIDRLQRAAPQSIGAYGTIPAITLTVPPATR